MAKFDPTRLIQQLQNTGLAIKDNPLYQLLFQMLRAMALINAEQNAASSSGSSSATVINQVIQQIISDSDSGGGGEPGPPGIPGIDGANGMIPYFIASTETFTIPLYKQAVFAMNIDNEGILVVDGFLIEVD